MKRRAVLANIGTVAAIGSAGCLGGATSPDNSATQTPTGTSTETTAPTIAEQQCPPVEMGHEKAVCSHTVDANTAPVYIEVTPENADLKNGNPIEEITLTFHNQFSKKLIFNPHSWSIWLNQGHGWEKLQKELSGNARQTVQPRTTHSWTLTEVVSSIREDPNLEPGLYIVAIGVPDPEQSDDWISCVALVELNAVT